MSTPSPFFFSSSTSHFFFFIVPLHHSSSCFSFSSSPHPQSQQTLPKTPGSGPTPADAFLSCTLNPLSSFVLVLCQTGKLFVFQPSGILVTSLTAAKARFTSVAASETHVILGTRTGHVQLYVNKFFLKNQKSLSVFSKKICTGTRATR
jgi:hypothetical protein